jgi:hypothetical protein
MLQRVFLSLFVLCFLYSAFGQELTSPEKLAQLYPTDEAKEKALEHAKIIKSKLLGTGITHPVKLTMQDGDAVFYAVFKKIDEHKSGMTQLSKGTEMDFKDSWHYDVAAYELDKMLGLNMVPVAVERKYNGDKGAVVWWVSNAMTEGDRKAKGLNPPDNDAWSQAMFKVRLFDNLIYNIDRNIGNLLIDSNWKIWMIDHTRSFKNSDRLKSQDDLTKFSLSMIQAIKKLDESSLKAHCGKYLSKYEIESMLKRRDEIVALFDQLHTSLGDSILYP